MKNTAKKRSRALLTIICVATMIFNLVATPAITANATRFNLDSPYLGFEEVDYTCHFKWLDSEGNDHMYNYSMLYEFDEADVQTFRDMLWNNTENTKGIIVRKYDLNGDGMLSMADFLSLYRQVEGHENGFEFHGHSYPYQLVKPYELNQDDINFIGCVLAEIIAPEDVTGVDISYYDYNFNAEIDLGDLILAKKYRATNPCYFLRDGLGRTMNPEYLASLLEAADSFGVENFVIVNPCGELIPYSILAITDSFYDGTKAKEIAPKYHAMQLLPENDTTLADAGLTITANLGNKDGTGISYWRYRYPDDNTFEGDYFWLLRRNVFDGFFECDFVLIPLDENGNRLGTLYPSAKEAQLAPEGVNFYSYYDD